MLEERDFQQRMQQLEGLIRKIETAADPDLRASALEFVQSLMELHGAGLEQILDLVSQAGEPGRVIIDSFASDELVGSLLLLYGLHPVDFETRVMGALDKVRPYLRSHGGNVELLGVAEGVVRLRLQGSCHGCASSAMTLKLAIEEAIYEAAPDVVALSVEGVAEHPPPSGFVPLGGLRGKGHTPQPDNDGGWEEVGGLESLAPGSLRIVDISGRSILFCRLAETFYAYGNTCPGCHETLQGASLEATTLVCPSCGQHYDVMRAGRGLDTPGLHLEPLPLLVEQGRAKVALPQAASYGAAQEHPSDDIERRTNNGREADAAQTRAPAGHAQG